MGTVAHVTRRDALALGAAAGAMAQKDPKHICFLPATELARLLRRKELSAREVLEAHLAQIDRLNPQLNAIVTLVADQARAQAKRADEMAARGKFLGPLHGLPIAHKDLHETRGIRTTYGSPIFRDNVPDFDALIVERIRAAGAITVGKTNTPEFGAGSQTFNPVFGATRNPYDHSRTCGGSSGGAAVALACGMIAIADGSDMGGSLRNPAAFCSVAGFRTSPGRVPKLPNGSPWSPLSVQGPMSRSVGGVALLLSAIAGPDSRCPLSIHEQGLTFARELARDYKGAKIAWCADFAGVPFEQPVRAVFDQQRKIFESLGCLVEESQLDWSGADDIFKTIRAQSYYASYYGLLDRHRAEMKPTVIEEIERGANLTPADLARADRLWSLLYDRVGQFMRKYEFFVLPTTQVLPFDVDQQYVASIDGQPMAGYIDWMRSCYYVTLTSLPAISVPAGFSESGLPVGLQIVGRHHNDWGTLQLAHSFEQARKLPVREF